MFVRKRRELYIFLDSFDGKERNNAEMDGHAFVAMMSPIGRFITEKDITERENKTIDKVVGYIMPETGDFGNQEIKQMLGELKQYHSSQ